MEEALLGLYLMGNPVRTQGRVAPAVAKHVGGRVRNEVVLRKFRNDVILRHLHL